MFITAVSGTSFLWTRAVLLKDWDSGSSKTTPCNSTLLITPCTTPNHPCWPQTWARAAGTLPGVSREEIHSLGPKWIHYPHGISSFWGSSFLLCKHRSFCFTDTSEATGPDWNLGQFWRGSPHLPWEVCRASLLWKHLPEKLWSCSLQETIWIYLIKPLMWFLFTPCRSWGCRRMAQQQPQQRMDRWTQSIPGHPWSLHCHFFLVFYPLWCREESSPFSKRGTEAQRPQLSIFRSLTGPSQLPLKVAGELQPLLKISAWTSHPQISLLQSQHLIQSQSPQNPC